MMVLALYVVVVGLLVILLVAFKINKNNILLGAVVVCLVVAGIASLKKYIEFGPHVEIEGWKVGVFIAAVSFIEVAGILWLSNVMKQMKK
jgi:hypothetical protein